MVFLVLSDVHHFIYLITETMVTISPCGILVNRSQLRDSRATDQTQRKNSKTKNILKKKIRKMSKHEKNNNKCKKSIFQYSFSINNIFTVINSYIPNITTFLCSYLI